MWETVQRADDLSLLQTQTLFDLLLGRELGADQKQGYAKTAADCKTLKEVIDAAVVQNEQLRKTKMRRYSCAERKCDAAAADDKKNFEPGVFGSFSGTGCRRRRPGDVGTYSW